MNAKKFKLLMLAVLLLAPASRGLSDGLRDWVRSGNRLYNQGQYAEAMKEYDRALTEEAAAPEVKFNKANALYRLEEYGDAMALYGEVAAKSRDMGLVAKSRYNLGNCRFRQGMRQKDSDLKKCMEELEASVSAWRQVLDIQPENINAAKNIETARLIIKDIMDQLNKQKQEQEKSGDKNKDPNEQQQEDKSQQDENSQQKQDEQFQEKSEQTDDPNEQQPEQQEQQQEQIAPKVSAEDILDAEQRQRKEREKYEKGAYIRVEKDW